MCEANPDGTVCGLLLNDLAGDLAVESPRDFLDHDGDCYRADPIHLICTAARYGLWRSSSMLAKTPCRSIP